MIASRSSLNTEILQSELLKDSAHATILVSGRELGGQGSRFRNSTSATRVRSSHDTSNHKEASDARPTVSFLSSTVPETIEHSIAEPVAEGAPMEEEGETGAQSQASDNATQEISQSALDVVRSRSEQISLRNEETLPGVEAEDEGVLQDTPQEGDSAFIDLISSFDAPLGEEESVPVNFSPSQSHPPLTQFPESQRFKTPATAGKKRDYNGNVVDTPAVSRNPFARGGPQTPGNVVGLTQAFAQTQAASSPFVNVPTSGLRSDMPSPGLEVEKHIAHLPSSSPLRPLSEVKRAATEPADRYVPAGHSQLLRTSSVDGADHDANAATQVTDYDGFDSGASTLDRQRRARLREARAREQLKTASSPLSPEKHDPPPQKRAESERPTTTRQISTNSLPSSPPPISYVVAEGEDDQEINGELHRSVAGHTVGPTTGDTRESPQKAQLHQTAAATVIPETTKRGGKVVAQSFPLTQPSPSVRGTRSGRINTDRDLISSGPVRVANSQRSAPSTQEPARKFPVTSSGDSVDVVPASPEHELVATQSPKAPHPQLASAENVPVEEAFEGEVVDGGGDEVEDEDEDELEDEANDDEPVFAPEEQSGNGLPTSTVPETSSGREQSDVQRHSTYATAPTNQTNDHTSAPADWSSQPVQPPPGRKRKRMEDISQDDIVPPATQSSSFDPAEALALDEDPEAARALASTQDEDPIPPRKRARFNHVAIAPELGIEETRSLSHGTNANIGRRVSARNAELDDGDNDDTENNAPENHENDDIEPQIARNVATTPTRTSRRKSAWDMDDSPKPRHVPKVLEPRSQPVTTTIQHKATQRVRRTGMKNRPQTPSTLPSIEETSPDPLAVSTTSTAPSTPQESTDQIVAPSMIFAFFNDGRSKDYYPAISLGASADARHHKIKWPGYDPEDVPSHAVCSLDLRVGDEVKVDIDKYPRIGYIIREFRCFNENPASADNVTDIYGHTHVLIGPKKQNVSLPKGVSKDKPIPISDIYIPATTWRRVNTRPAAYKTSGPTDRTSRISTPLERALTPATPSSRGRQIDNDAVLLPSRLQGVFANMVFALSFVDETKKDKVSNLITGNGGIIVKDSFQDLVDDDLTLKIRFNHIRFAALLADKHSRKVKYMEALAFGLPCLSGKWAEASVQGSRLASWQDYLLPAGESKELDGAVRSRILPDLDLETNKLGDMLARRTKYFDRCSVVFVNTRGKGGKMEKREPHLTLIQVMGANQVAQVADLSAAKEKLQAVDKAQPTWLFVEDKDYVKACKVVEEVKKELAGKGRKKSTTTWTCEVVKNEFVMQSLIMGRLTSRV
ncbi:radiation sensitive protein rad9 [Knufia obscura]|uniref:Radiation sensitive protein rad9 n=1 Tax=Knufia obscura TaxID=1635080 RepID=A0ABR0RBE9_9EURO|nr:radiation sensitive protein rad9 [Knufia obscura]